MWTWKPVVKLLWSLWDVVCMCIFVLGVWVLRTINSDSFHNPYSLLNFNIIIIFWRNCKLVGLWLGSLEATDNWVSRAGIFYLPLLKCFCSTPIVECLGHVLTKMSLKQTRVQRYEIFRSDLVANNFQPILTQDKVKWKCSIKETSLKHVKMETSCKIVYNDDDHEIMYYVYICMCSRRFDLGLIPVSSFNNVRAKWPT